MMKKFIASSFIVVAFALYVFASHQNGNGSSMTTSSTTAPAARADTTTPPAPATTANTQYKDGQYTGEVADAFYGPLQVRVTISHGAISDVEFLQYPNDRQTSIQVNAQAMPLLKQEALKAQDGHVDIVTGATDTSEAFIQTFSSALAQAKS